MLSRLAFLLLLFFPLGAQAALAIDGTAAGSSTAITGTATLTTASTNDVIVVLINNIPNTNPNTVASITDAAGLTWTLRKSFSWRGNTFNVSEWYAIAPAALTADVITVNMTSSSAYAYAIDAFGISGANTIHPFDPNATLPSASENNSTPACQSITNTISTTNTDTLLLLASYANGAGAPTRPAGFSPISGSYTTRPDFSYQIVAAPQSLRAVNYLYATCFSGMLLVDAVSAPNPPQTGGLLFHGI